MAPASSRRTALVLATVVIAMVGLAYGSVPLYRLFCQVTGYGGTPRIAETAASHVLERRLKIRFNADISRDLPWQFRPAQKEVSVAVGDQGLAFYRAENLASRTTTGVSVYNVTPLKAGAYFNKVDCFCFVEQALAPGQSVDMPVSFYIDPSIADDPNMDDVSTITLSYTFFPVTGTVGASARDDRGGGEVVSGS